MFIRSAAAGMLIGLASAIYLKVGSVTGAILFATGLFTILQFKFDLFTGKAGLLATGEIDWKKLVIIWLGNFVGGAIISVLILLTPQGEMIQQGAAAIMDVRITNFWQQNIILGIVCGMLMYIAVSRYDKAPYLTAMAVVAFILFGANHCIADMAYLCLANRPVDLPAAEALLCTTIGNVIGCNIIPLLAKFELNG